MPVLNSLVLKVVSFWLKTCNVYYIINRGAVGLWCLEYQALHLELISNLCPNEDGGE